MKVRLYTHRGQGVAFRRRGEEITYDSFYSHLREVTEEIEKTPIKTWLISCSNLYTFSVSLLAAATAGRDILLSPGEDRVDETHGLLTDQRNGRTQVIEVAQRPSSAPLSLPFTIEASTKVHLFTSGSTGARTQHTRTVQSLLLEVDILESLFGKDLGERDVLASVLPHHIYGLLFAVLWPLRCGRPIYIERIFFPDNLFDVPHSSLLISTPAQLKKLVNEVPATVLQNKIAAIFSSGGNLPRPLAATIEGLFNYSAIEIFGSTESGGVAWRRGDSRWTRLPQVQLAKSKAGLLLVQSPLTSSNTEHHEIGGQEWLLMHDRVELWEDGSFEHLGRGDRLIKIAEQKVSLIEVEMVLRSHPLVADCRVIPQGIKGTTRLIAVVECHKQNEELLIQELKSLSREKLPPLARPRVFKLVSELPRDEQGKCTELLIHQFVRDVEADEAPREPVVLEKIIQPEGHAEIQWLIPEGLIWCDGHFPAFPAVPGVVQLGWVVEVIKEMLAIRISPTAIEALKFHAVLVPKTRCTLTLSWNQEFSTASWILQDSERRYSSGRIRCGE